MRRFSRGRRAPRRLRWIIGSEIVTGGNGSPDEIVSTVVPGFVGSATTPAFTLLSTADVAQELDNSGTVMRIVGDFWMLNTSGTGTLWVQMGIKVTDVGATAAAYDVNDSLDAKWMWWKAFALAPLAVASSGSSSSSSAVYEAGVHHLDIKCRRRIVGDQQLEMYIWQGGIGWAPSSPVLNMVFASRILCKLQ